MIMPTKTLISKIEKLSSQLSPKQLESFLDIVDAVASLAHESHKVHKLAAKNKLCATEARSSQLH